MYKYVEKMLNYVKMRHFYAEKFWQSNFMSYLCSVKMTQR